MEAHAPSDGIRFKNITWALDCLLWYMDLLFRDSYPKVPTLEHLSVLFGIKNKFILIS